MQISAHTQSILPSYIFIPYGMFLAFVLCCANSVFGSGSAVSSDFFPKTVCAQLQRIVDSSADEVRPVQDVCRSILEDIEAVIFHFEHQIAESQPNWERFEQSIQTLENIQQDWTRIETEADPYIPSRIALEEIVWALQRRSYVWQALRDAESVESSPISTLYGKSFDDIDRLIERTLAAGQYFMRARRPLNNRSGQTWNDYLETHSWITELEASKSPAGESIRFVSLASPAIPVEVLQTLSNKANTTIFRLESLALTNEQRVFLNHPIVRTWKEELQTWTSDTETPLDILRYLEQYELTGGMSDMRAMSQFLDQLSKSKTPEFRSFSNHVRQQYDMPNVRVFLSNSLLNNHVPTAVSEIASFRDVVQSQPVVGRRQTDTELSFSFVPHPTRVLLSLDVGVDLATVSRSDAFATQLYNTGQTMVVARKLIELTENGFRTEPAQARIVDHRMRLIRVNTEFDDVPLISNLFRGVVRNQYESRFHEANTEARRKILRQVRSQIDRETEQKLRPVNEKIRTVAQYVEEHFDLRVEQRESRTDEHWLLTSWGIRSPGTLSGNTLAPETQPGSFADFKVHESLLNMLFGKLELEGKYGTVRDFKEMLADKFQLPALAKPAENDDVALVFASYNPVVVRFVDGKVEIRISIAALRLLGKTHRNFQAVVRYKPTYDSSGRLVLERDGHISLPTAPREQFILRATFGKIFPVSQHFTLVPKVLENDPQFDYLTTGHCRIENGWFALALVPKPEI